MTESAFDAALNKKKAFARDNPDTWVAVVDCGTPELANEWAAAINADPIGAGFAWAVQGSLVACKYNGGAKTTEGRPDAPHG